MSSATWSAVAWWGLAIHYGTYRRGARSKAGSLSFDGFHAIPIKGIEKRKRKRRRTTSFDPLLDGRYRGCPRGPVMVDLATVREAALKVGRSVNGHPGVYALLMSRAVKTVSGVDLAKSEPEPDVDEPLSLASIQSEADEPDVDEPLSLASILTDLVELDLPDPPRWTHRRSRSTDRTLPWRLPR